MFLIYDLKIFRCSYIQSSKKLHKLTIYYQFRRNNTLHRNAFIASIIQKLLICGNSQIIRLFSFVNQLSQTPLSIDNISAPIHLIEFDAM